MLSASVSVVCGSLIAHVAQPPALQVNVTEDILFGCAWLRGIIFDSDLGLAGGFRSCNMPRTGYTLGTFMWLTV